VETKNLSYVIDSLKDFFKEAGFSSSISPIDDINEKINVMATVGITGDHVGFLTLSINSENAVKLANSFASLMEVPIETINDFGTPHLEVLSELSNQIDLSLFGSINREV